MDDYSIVLKKNREEEKDVWLPISNHRKLRLMAASQEKTIKQCLVDIVDHAYDSWDIKK